MAFILWRAAPPDAGAPSFHTRRRNYLGSATTPNVAASRRQDRAFRLTNYWRRPVASF